MNQVLILKFEEVLRNSWQRLANRDLEVMKITIEV